MIPRSLGTQPPNGMSGLGGAFLRELTPMTLKAAHGLFSPQNFRDEVLGR